MNQKQINRLIKELETKNVSFDKGLSDIEINSIESCFEIQFPDDLKSFLQTKLPVSKGFVDWRFGLNHEDEIKRIHNRLNWPIEGILSSIKNGFFWLELWGDKPEKFEDQKVIALKELNKKIRLIPIYSHRYIPSVAHDYGAPVFSVHQIDIIYYGYDLASYLANEFSFNLPSSFGTVSTPKRVGFWSDMVDRMENF